MDWWTGYGYQGEGTSPQERFRLREEAAQYGPAPRAAEPPQPVPPLRPHVPAHAAHIDFETRSTVDLKSAGVYRYAEHHSTQVIVMRWRIGINGPVIEWLPGDEDPLDLLAHVESGGTIVAHNAAFERTIWNVVLPRQGCAHWPKLLVEQQDCTMSRAVALALPGALDNAGAALKAPIQKDKEGHRLMMQMCKPRRVEEDGTVVWWGTNKEDPDDLHRLARLSEYCGQDVEAETAIDAILPALSPQERRVWELDQKINDRGVMIDTHSVERCLEVVEEAGKRADARMWWLTDGEVKKCTEVAKIVAWLNSRGIPCYSVAKGEIDELILGASVFGDDAAEEVIRLRRAAAKTSTNKFKAMLRSVCADMRSRGTLAYHVASTGRWGGRLWQPQNLPRVDADTELSDVLRIVEFLAWPKSKGEFCDMIEMMIGPALEWLSKCLRAMVVAGPGMKFVSGDFSNIEGRFNAWVAGEQWKLEAFRAYDAGLGPDLYRVAYGRSFGVLDLDSISKPQRQIGKVQELALGYQGSVGAYIAMGATYGLRAADVALVAKGITPEGTWRQVGDGYSTDNSHGLGQDVWTGVKHIVNQWREAHPRIVQSWWDLQDAAIEAVGSPGMIVSVLTDRVQYVAANGFLFCRLPSGRVLAYADPKLVWEEDAQGRKRNKVQYWGTDSMTKKWTRQYLYGGKQCDHVVQGGSRDILVESMFRVEDANYPIVLTVHDEILSEVPENFGSADEYKRIMSVLPAWLTDFPLATATWEDKRYVK